jgi:methionyl-tRNA formyltransferase
MNLVVMGSGKFALPVLDALAGSAHKVLAVVTQPDRPRGRGRRAGPTPVARHAAERGLFLYQPDPVGDPDFLRQLRALAPDLIVVAAYGQILPPELLTMPTYGCVNVHPSLLPRWRGPAPVARVILHGESKTGVTVHRVVAKMDAGDILDQRETDVGPEDTTATLEARLAELAAPLTLAVIEQTAAGTLRPRRQDERKASYARKFKKEEGLIRWKRGAVQIANMVRAMQPYPGAFTHHQKTRLVIGAARAQPRGDGNAAPGTVTAVEADHFRVRCGEGELAVLELQPESRRRMNAQEFLAGHPLKAGDLLR